MIASVPPADIPSLERNTKVRMACGPSTRVLYWTMDVAREQALHITAKDGKPIANPLRDLRVRQALSLAIDRAAMVRTVMNGMAIATNQFASEGLAATTRRLQSRNTTSPAHAAYWRRRVIRTASR